MLPALIALAFVDTAMLKTLLSWTAYACVIAGLSVIISRIIFPQIDLSELVSDSRRGNRASATIAAALIVFFGLLFLSIVMWVKA